MTPTDTEIAELCDKLARVIREDRSTARSVAPQTIRYARKHVVTMRKRKFIHPDYVPQELREAARLLAEEAKIVWPSEPWSCPVCQTSYATHALAGTIGTLPSPWERTFQCFECEKKEFNVLAATSSIIFVDPATGAAAKKP
jgi:impB/mucB/samB family C-terminal domain